MKTDKKWHEKCVFHGQKMFTHIYAIYVWQKQFNLLIFQSQYQENSFPNIVPWPGGPGARVRPGAGTCTRGSERRGAYLGHYFPNDIILFSITCYLWFEDYLLHLTTVFKLQGKNAISFHNMNQTGGKQANAVCKDHLFIFPSKYCQNQIVERTS